MTSSTAPATSARSRSSSRVRTAGRTRARADPSATVVPLRPRRPAISKPSLGWKILAHLY